MTNKEDIDQLFRSKLLQQEIPVDEQAMHAAMQMLHDKGGNGAAWKWLGAMAIIIGLGIGVCAVIFSNKKTEESYLIGQNIRSSAQTVPPSASQKTPDIVALGSSENNSVQKSVQDQKRTTQEAKNNPLVKANDPNTNNGSIANKTLDKNNEGNSNEVGYSRINEKKKYENETKNVSALWANVQANTAPPKEFIAPAKTKNNNNAFTPEYAPEQSNDSPDKILNSEQGIVNTATEFSDSKTASKSETEKHYDSSATTTEQNESAYNATDSSSQTNQNSTLDKPVNTEFVSAQSNDSSDKVVNSEERKVKATTEISDSKTASISDAEKQFDSSALRTEQNDSAYNAADSSSQTNQNSTLGKPLADVDTNLSYSNTNGLIAAGSLLKNWDLRIAASLIHVGSTFSSTNNLLTQYIDQRNQQETSLYGFGADVSVTKNFEKSYFSAGLGFSKTGEIINYSGLKTEYSIADNSYWLNGTPVTFMVIDGTGSNNTLVFDTTFITLYTDSIFISDINSAISQTENTALSTHNGATSLIHLLLPISCGYRLAQLKKSEIYINGLLEFDYLAKKNAHYLSTNREQIIPLSAYPQQRSFLMNAGVGIEWRKQLIEDKLYLMLHPGFKTNLYSWNKDFKHNNYMPYLRVGVGFKF